MMILSITLAILAFLLVAIPLLAVLKKMNTVPGLLLEKDRTVGWRAAVHMTTASFIL
jgi:hypothetical protein